MKKSDINVYNYIIQHWIPIKEMWVPAFLKNVVTLGTKVNGVVKCVHPHIRDALKEHDSLNDCLVALHNAARKSCNALQREGSFRLVKYKRYNVDKDLHEFLNLLTDYASEKTYNDIVRESDITMECIDEDFAVCLDDGNSYKVDRNNAVCTCPLNSIELLPCRHLVKVHYSVGLHTGTPCRYPRWLRSYNLQSLSMASKNTEQNNVSSAMAIVIGKLKVLEDQCSPTVVLETIAQVNAIIQELAVENTHISPVCVPSTSATLRSNNRFSMSLKRRLSKS
ncbi:hypothetical protein MN116_004310 [Schistosoma mekongi]|uniref:SWIM-type domain-containing protein n=1 Tax=Schistosoma mekongi TaxID=38744 RepID=A0AAE2D6F9_SCHME|nr:hypothetical protein MN116_004310 [Schistosoma mekongi]